MFLRNLVFFSFLCVSISHAHVSFDVFSNKPANTNTNAAPKSANLLDVSVNVDPLLNLLGQNNRPGVVASTPTPTSTSTTTELPSTTARKPTSISNRYTFTPEVAKCGQKVVQHTELITNGLSTKPGDWPWHAALYRLKNTGSQQQYICGGSLISPTRVLTAAHCVHENNAVILPERMFVTLGKYNLAGGDMDAQERSVFDILVHPGFDRSTLAHDIAILKLSARVAYSNYVQPICLWDDNNSDKSAIVNTIGTVVGWGFTEQDTLATQLTSATMPVADDLSCIKSNPVFYSKFINDGTFCAGYRNGTSVCNGDSGGGMYFKQRGADGQEAWAVRGIVSLSASRKDKNLCDPTEYTIFTDAAQYRDFINHHL